MSPLDRLAWLRAAAAADVPASALRVAVTIAWRLNMDAGNARPSVAGIAADIGTDPRTVQRGARALEALGLLTVEHPAGRSCCTYAPANPGSAATVQPRQDCQGSDAPTPAIRVANPGNSCRQPRQRCHPNKDRTRTEQGLGARTLRFMAPTVEEVAAYCAERSNAVDPQRFTDYYAARGWRMGSTKVKDWKACVRTWEARDRTSKPAADTAGMTFNERQMTVDEIRALMDMPLGGPSRG